MAADRKVGRSFILDHWAKYEKLMRDSLKLRNFTGTTARKSDGVFVALQAASPSVTVLVISSPN